MGKKSLIKSTAKKKSGTKEGEEKAAKKKAAKAAKKAAGKSTQKKAAKKITAKSSPPKKAATKKKTTKAKTKTASKKISIKDLVFKTFAPTQTPPPPVPAPKPSASTASAPGWIESTELKDIDRLRSLLFHKFDMAQIKATAKQPVPQKTEKPKPVPKNVSIKDLVFKTFVPTQTPPPPVPAPKPNVSTVSAPGWIESTELKDIDRLRSLLLHKFDMAQIKAAAKQPAPYTPKPVSDDKKPAPVQKSTHEAEQTSAQSDQDSAYITLEPNAQKTNQAPPIGGPIKIAVAVAAMVVFFILAISYNNGSKYYIHPTTENAVAVWKGCFSPKDRKLFMELDNTQIVGPTKEVYTKKEVFPLVLNYYVNKADALLDGPDLPDFESIKGYLDEAEKFAVTKESKTTVTSRLNNIERMILLYKADVGMSKNTEDSISSAIKQLKKAEKLTSNEIQSEEISNKIDFARKQIESLNASPEKPAENTKITAPTPKPTAPVLKPAPVLKHIPKKEKPAPDSNSASDSKEGAASSQ